MAVKYLIIRFSSIGDIVLTTPIIRCLKTQVENAEVHYLTKPAFAPLLSNNPYIDKLITLKESLSNTIKEIRGEEYDYIIDLHHNLRTYIIKNKTGILTFSFPKLNFKKALLVNFKINRLPDVHIVDRYFETVKIFDVKNDGKRLELFISPNDEVDIKTLPEPFHHGYLALVVGAKHTTKQLPFELLKNILLQLDIPILLLGDQNDNATGDKITEWAKRSNIFNACGKYSLLQSASLIRQAKVVLTGDTGLMHIGAAFNKKMVTVWGNTVPEFGMYPYSDKNLYTINEVKSLPCRPCSKIGFDQCPKKHFNCMIKQDTSSIVNQVKSFYE
ncbi:MAG: glycosyltransferase family 9 protein [Bacteroidales bacterium]